MTIATMATTTGPGSRNECNTANGELLAAAPDLLEALENLLSYADGYSDTMRDKLGRGAEGLGTDADSSSVSGMARAAIAKAKGGNE